MSPQSQQLTVTIENSLMKVDQSSPIKYCESRFGTVSINPENSILFPYGIAGIPNGRHFCMADLPENYQRKLPNFRILQSLDDVDLSFIVMPVDIENSFIEKKDLFEGCSALGINKEDLLVILVTSIHRSTEKTTLSVNARAPILVDTKQKMAAQYIFMNNKYQIRQMLDE